LSVATVPLSPGDASGPLCVFAFKVVVDSFRGESFCFFFLYFISLSEVRLRTLFLFFFFLWRSFVLAHFVHADFTSISNFTNYRCGGVRSRHEWYVDFEYCVDEHNESTTD
jgi:hypothetical protein